MPCSRLNILHNVKEPSPVIARGGSYGVTSEPQGRKVLRFTVIDGGASSQDGAEMAGTREIAIAIQDIVGRSYEAWRIGLTSNLDDRKSYWAYTKSEDVSRWQHWAADSIDVAQTVEAYFIRQGMEGGTGGDLLSEGPIYVYIF